MGKQRALLEVDPLSLPVGMRIGSWRVEGFRGRGSYGTLYRVEWEGYEEAGSFALKLAITPGDPRFEHEAELLRRIQSLHVPRLHAHGVWQHPSGAFPYLVMEWVDGEALYDWASRRNPSSRQVMRLLAQAARALAATHAADGVHRDVKGDNILVRMGDGRVFLTDFGAGRYRGAGTLTSRLLPPSTPAYRSPEAWGFVDVFRRHPTAHYPASACDDLFALGVTAYRLVTDEYPPLTQPGEPGAEVWREGGPGPRPPRELNPRVSPELETVIQRLLAIAPVERFSGSAQEAAQALEQAAEAAGPEADAPLFMVGHEHGRRWRSPGGLHLAEKHDAAAREELEKQRARERERPVKVTRPVASRAFALTWRAAWAACLAVGLSLVVARWTHREPQRAPAPTPRESREDRSVAVGDSARIAPAESSAPELGGKSGTPVGRALPEKPLPGQLKPPCSPNGEVVIRGGCWHRIADARPPCGEDMYDWQGACYTPRLSGQRQPTSDPP
ncbi:MAG: serine/threonine protein kinase [Hyalangium sp.]|uniref:serine/threonine protein kinase n=1 Tax=Hyalangium sp. TaxID=2028555 RepID=UPI003899E658